MNETKVEFASAGRRFAGFVFEPENAAPHASGGVTVLHGGAGPGPHERERAERLTELGYVAFVPDLFGEVFETRQRGVEVITGLVSEPALLRSRLVAALDCLCAQPSVDESRIAAIGFCFGGLAALELARSGASAARRRQLPWWPRDTGSSRNQRRAGVDSRLHRRGGSVRHSRASSGIRRRDGPGKRGLAASRPRERDARVYRTRHSAAWLGLSRSGRSTIVAGNASPSRAHVA